MQPIKVLHRWAEYFATFPDVGETPQLRELVKLTRRTLVQHGVKLPRSLIDTDEMVELDVTPHGLVPRNTVAQAITRPDRIKRPDRASKTIQEARDTIGRPGRFARPKRRGGTT